MVKHPLNRFIFPIHNIYSIFYLTKVFHYFDLKNFVKKRALSDSEEKSTAMVLDRKHRPKVHLPSAIPFMLLASFILACMSLIVKTGAGSLPPSALVFWRSFISLILLLPWLQLGPPAIPFREKIKTAKWHIHFIRGFSSFLSSLVFFYSLKYLDLTSATVLLNTLPIFVPIVLFFWHKTPIYHNLWWAIGVAFVGILFIVQPGTAIFEWASLLALLGGIIGAIALVSLRSGHYTEPSYRILFYLFLICTVAGGLLSLFSFKESWLDLTITNLELYLLMGLCGFLYQVVLTTAIKFAPLRLTSPFLYLSMIFTFIFDKVIWKTPFSTLSLVGFFLVVVGAFLTIALYPKEDLQS